MDTTLIVLTTRTVLTLLMFLTIQVVIKQRFSRTLLGKGRALKTISLSFWKNHLFSKSPLTLHTKIVTLRRNVLLIQIRDISDRRAKVV